MERSRLSLADLQAALDLPPETISRLEQGGAFHADASGRYDPLAVAAAVARHGEQRAEAADRRLAAVAAAISDVKPALERLAGLAGHARLEGEAHERAMVEVAAFFTAFAGAMNRATAALGADEGA